MSCKRWVDLFVGSTLAIVTLPILALAVTWSALVYRTSPFFVQRRVGHGGEHFRFVKVRTLPPDTGRYLDKYSIDFTQVPASMRLIRRLHVDELPQLWQVAWGRMSLIGPRPEMANLLRQLPPSIAQKRQSIRPGLSGLWQVSRHCDGLIVERPEYDVLYIEHWCAGLDTWIFAQTIRKVVTGHRITLSDVPRWAMPGPSNRSRRIVAPAAIEV